MRGWYGGARAQRGARGLLVRWGVRVAILLVTGAALVSAAVALAAPSDLDTSFSGDGKVQVDFGGYDRATHVALTPDGRIVAVGTTAPAANGSSGHTH